MNYIGLFATTFLLATLVQASDFNETDKEQHAYERKAFMDWYKKVDVTKKRSYFEDWYYQADISDFTSLDTINTKYQMYLLENGIISSNIGANLIVLGKSRTPEAEFVSFETPRVVFSRRSLSIGQAVNHNEIQIIAELNDGSKRRKFMKMSNLNRGTHKPLLTVVPQESCLACHQTGAEHLTTFPWLDTHQNELVFQKVQSTMEKTNEKKKIPSHLNPLSIGFLNRNLFAADATIRSINKDIQVRRVCEDLCGEDLNVTQIPRRS